MSLTRVDFPEPETPVTAVITPSGNRTSMFLRLCSRAPRTTSALPEPVRRRVGIGISRSPERYFAVSDSGKRMSSSGDPSATIRPPWTPAPGPRSITQSADRIVSSSCSTTMTVLPRSRIDWSVSMSLRLSRWWRPIDGSSST